MKQIEVVAAIIKKGNRMLAAQRGYGEFKGGWEFPGGKIEEGESKEEAIKREIKEELNADIVIKKYLVTVEHDYINFHLIMHCYLCELLEEKLTLLEHQSLNWLLKEELDSVEWLPADQKVIEVLKVL